MVVRLFLLLLGIVLGVAGTLAYGIFIAADPAPTPRPVATHAPVTVSLDQSFLTAIVQRNAAAAPGVDVPRTQVRAEIVNDTIVVHAAVKVLDQTTDGTVTLRPELAAGGKLRIDVVSTNLGTIQLPGVDEAIAQQINERLHALLQDLPVVVTGVSVDPVRGLTVTGQVDLQQLENAAVSTR
jgi:uncharacterized protein YpmS